MFLTYASNPENYESAGEVAAAMVLFVIGAVVLGFIITYVVHRVVTNPIDRTFSAIKPKDRDEHGNIVLTPKDLLGFKTEQQARNWYGDRAVDEYIRRYK